MQDVPSDIKALLGITDSSAAKTVSKTTAAQQTPPDVIRALLGWEGTNAVENGSAPGYNNNWKNTAEANSRDSLADNPLLLTGKYSKYRESLDSTHPSPPLPPGLQDDASASSYIDTQKAYEATRAEMEQSGELLTEGAGDVGKFKSWDDFKGYIQDVGKDASLTNKEKVQIIQKAYDGIADKTDINIPISDKYVKGFKANGEIEYDWPAYLGFDIDTIKPISRDNLLPETWDRTGPMNGSNFSDVPESGRYSNSERSVPYVENEKAYHSGKFNNATYFDKIDAIKSGDLDALNEILIAEGIPELDALEFEDLYADYNDFIAKIAEEVGTYVDATYGLTGTAAAWGDLKGGAGQIVTPFSGRRLIDLGIII